MLFITLIYFITIKSSLLPYEIEILQLFKTRDKNFFCSLENQNDVILADFISIITFAIAILIFIFFIYCFYKDRICKTIKFIFGRKSKIHVNNDELKEILVEK